MPLLGAQLSVAGGLHRAFDRLRQVEGEALQIFPPIVAMFLIEGDPKRLDAFASAGKC